MVYPIPASLVTTNADEMNLFFNDINIVTKTISRQFNFIDKNVIVKSFTEIIKALDISKEFAPSLVQEYIEKEYEIRSFYLKGSFYSMAIFSQKNDATKIDYRKPASIKSRSVPYNLPRNIEEKLVRLMTQLNLDTGSIDIIKAKNGSFYFLEVNPNGIFENVSFYCNYYLEKLIADHLNLK